MKNRTKDILLFFALVFTMQPLFTQDEPKDRKELVWRTKKYGIFIPGEKGIRDSITMFYQTPKNEPWRPIGDDYYQYSNGSLSLQEKRGENHLPEYAIGYYPNGKTWFEDFYSERGIPLDFNPDSIKGYYPWGGLHYRIHARYYGESTFYFYHRADENGEDEVLKMFLDNNVKKFIEVYYPDGTLMEEDRPDSNEQGAPYRSWRTGHIGYGCGQNPRISEYSRMDKYYYRLNKKYFPDKKIRSITSYCQSTWSETKHVNYYREWDYSGHLLYEGGSYGIPDSIGYVEVYKKFYPNGRVEWELRDRLADALLTWDPETIPAAWFMDAGEHLIHYDEQGNVIKKLGHL